MKECLLNFVQDLFKFPWTREEFLRCNSFRESYDTFHYRIGDCSFDEYLEFFREFNMECSALKKSIGKLSDEQLEQVSGGGAGRFIAIPMLALTLLSGVANVTGFAASIKAPVAVSTQSNVQDEWEKTRSFVDRAGDPWLSMLPVEGEDGFNEYKDPKVDFDKKDEKVVLGEVQKDGNSGNNVYPQIYEIVQNLIKAADNDSSNLKKDLKRAKYIYEWIAKNIKYDQALYDSDKSPNNNTPVPPNSEYDFTYRARPDVVFEKRSGVCEGFARLARLMMRIAKIPCAFVGSPKYESDGEAHAFNAIYVEKTNEGGDHEKGWTLMDATWGMQEDRLDAKINEKKLHDNFPAAYDNKSLKENNISMMYDMFHQLREIENDNSYILNGVKYTVGNDGILVTSDLNNPVSLQIPPEILALGRKIEIGEGIKEYKCSGDEEIDIGSAYDLKEVNTDNSRRYKIKGSVLRDNYNGKVEILPIEGVNYTLKDSYIYVSANFENPVSLKIPQGILDLGLKIVIGPGIKEYIYSGDEEIDISQAKDLLSIKTLENGKYKFNDYILYENEKAVGILPTIEGYRYTLKDNYIYVSGKLFCNNPLKIPQKILDLGLKIVIGTRIEEYIYSGNEEIDISEAWNLQSIKTPENGKYKFNDYILYENEKAVGILPKIEGFHYTLKDNYIYVSDKPFWNRPLKVPQKILDLGLRIVIGTEIEKYIYSGDEEIDISGAKNLQSITGNSERYSKFEGGVLYKKDESIADLKPGASVDIGGVTYCRESQDAIKISSKTKITNFLTPPPEILALNNKIVIGEGITKYKCSKTEEIDIVDAENLIEINTEDSERYSKFEDGILYYKEGYKDGEKVAYLAPEKHVNINKVDYFRNADNSIQISSTDLKTDPTLIPKSILGQRHKEAAKSGDNNKNFPKVAKVKIRNGIGHYVCSGNEEIDISDARDLEFIDTSKSERYIFSDNILYEKCIYESKKAVAILPRIGEFNYSLRENGSIYVSSASKKSNNLEIPESILRLHRRIVLGPGIQKYICFGDEEIDISEATSLESIDTYDSEVYDRLKDGVLYKKDGSVADLAPGASVVVDRVKYYRDHKDFHSITVSAADLGYTVALTSTLPILDLGHKIVIGEGIEAYKCYGSEEIDISEAYNLQFIDLTISSVYSDFSKGVLYKKDRSVADLKPGALVLIDKVKYYREYSDCHSIYVYGNPNNFITLTPPLGILNLNSKIKIGRGIGEYKCSGNEEIDISQAKDLQSITGYSGRYSKFEDGKLYDNNRQVVGEIGRT